MSEMGESRYCPACHKPYADWPALKKHLLKAQTEGDQLHLDILEIEDWEAVLRSSSTVKGLPIVEDEELA